MGLEIGGHAGDRVREVAGVEVFERSFSTPVEMLVTRQLKPETFGIWSVLRGLVALDRRGLVGFGDQP